MVGSLDDGLTVRAIGPATAAGRISLSELARIASAVQATLERIALSVAGSRQKSGRRPVEIVDAVRMDFVGFREGSAVLELDRARHATTEELLPTDLSGPTEDLLGESFDVLVDGIRQIRQNSTRPAGETGRHFNSTVINGLAELCGGIGGKNLTRIEFASNGAVHFTLDSEAQMSLRRIRRATVAHETVIVGRLHMGDFDPMTLRCRIDTNLESIWCDFDIGLKEAVFNLLDQMVVARGTAELNSDGVSVRLLHMTEITALDTATTRSLDDLATEQGVSTLADVGRLRGEPVEDFDLFLEAIRASRGGE